MSLDVSYHPESIAELRAEIAWYEERRLGLGDQFETQVDSVIDGILRWPESGAVWPGWDSIPVVRSLQVPGFPYRLIYLVMNGGLMVVAVAHQRRMPGYWRDRLSAV